MKKKQNKLLMDNCQSQSKTHSSFLMTKVDFQVQNHFSNVTFISPKNQPIEKDPLKEKKNC